MTGPPVVLVDETSATQARPFEDQAHNIQGINRTHSDLVKFGGRDEAYDIVLSYLEEFAENAVDVVKARFKMAESEAAKDFSKTRKS